MGYSTSRKSIKKVEPYLQQLVAAESNIEFPVNDPVRFSYQLREAIKSAKEFAFDAIGNRVSPFADYAQLASKFIIRTHGLIVRCELRDVVPIVKLRESMSTMSIPDVEDTLGIIGAAVKHKATEMVFPAASEDSIDPVILYNWARKNEYYLVVSDSHVTLTRNNPGELAWTP